MTLLGIVLAILAVVVGTGAYRIHELLSEFLNGLLDGFVSPAAVRKFAFIVVAVLLASILAPFLLPVDLTIQVSVWILYLVFFAVGAWRLYEFGLVVRADLQSKRK